MNEDKEFEEAFGEELPTEITEKSEAALMREQEADEFNEGWGMFPDGDGDADHSAETTPVRTGSANGSDIGAQQQTVEMNFMDTHAKAKSEGAKNFIWNGRSFETRGNEYEIEPVAQQRAKLPTNSKNGKPTKPPARAPARAPVEVLSEDEADTRQLAKAPPARLNVNTPSNIWPNNQPAKNIYANAGPSTSASPQTQAARAKLAENLKGKASVADVMKSPR